MRLFKYFLTPSIWVLEQGKKLATIRQHSYKVLNSVEKAGIWWVWVGVSTTFTPTPHSSSSLLLFFFSILLIFS